MADEVRLIDANALRLMKVKECAGHTIEFAAGWKACVEYCKNDAPTIDVNELIAGKANELIERVDQAYHDAVDDAQHYWYPNTAQDALEDAYDKVDTWINELLLGKQITEEGENS